MIRCDDRQLKVLLEADEFASGSGEIASHVESCAHCQERLVSLAASDDEWRDVKQWLSPDQSTRYEKRLEVGRQPRRPAWSESIVRQLLEPPSHPEMLGRLGRYEIERLIGSGGMGIVFKAYDTELNRTVAIKVLAPHLAGSEAARQRFAREARAAAGIVDDHVVPIHNVESEHDPPYLVMQYVAGGSLQEKLDRRGPLEVMEILRIGVQTAKGLAAAHAQGLIHRDVKPSNILLDEGVERALLTDFGLARAEGDACLTRTGAHPGTPHYMSPEQVRGEAIDGRSDLFSLGCVLYTLCTGRLPFNADSAYAVLRRITDDSPRPVRHVNPDIPEWLNVIVMTLLEKDRDQRFPSAGKVAQTLGQWLGHLQHPAAIPAPAAVLFMPSDRGRRRRTLKRLVGAAASVFLLFAGILVVLEAGKGTIRIESEVDDVPICITRGDKVVDTLTVSKSGQGVRVSAGKYEVRLNGEFSGVDIRDGMVTIGTRDRKVIRIVQSHSDAQDVGGKDDVSDAIRPDNTISPSDFLRRYSIDGRAYRAALQELSAAEAMLKRMTANPSDAQAAMDYRQAENDVGKMRLAALQEGDRVLRELQIRLDTLGQIKVESFGASEGGEQEAKRIRIDKLLLQQALKEMQDAQASLRMKTAAAGSEVDK
ncbi:MAG: serine/threonine protein kinase [Planctomycetales bacterium]|nr:serine/threonine protein kinase [Planctomycetales bacterium]